MPPSENERPEGDPAGRVALHYAAAEDDVAEATAILDAGADPSPVDGNGFTPLHLAAQEGSVGTARVLLTHGAAVDPADRFGNTPLWRAVFNSRGDGSMIELLRGHGADPQRQNDAGVSPLALARTIANFDVARYFADLP